MDVDGRSRARVSGLAPTESATRIALSERATWVTGERCVVGALVEGRLDVIVDDGGKTWDHASAVLLVEEAGGTFLDPARGKRLDLGWGLYCDGVLDGELHALLDLG
jgi:histidinol-phosphatase